MSSRRQRRRKEAAVGAKGRWFIRILVGGLLGLLVVFGGGYLWLGKWLHGEGFRRMISDGAGEATRTKAEFGTFDWSGTLLQTPSFDATGDSLVRSIDAKGLKVDVGIAAAWHGVLEIDNARARSINIELDASAPAEKPITGTPPDQLVDKKPAKWYDRFLPHEVDLRMIQVDSSALKIATKSGAILSTGTGWKVEPDQTKGSYKAEARGGKLALPWKWAPPMELGMARLRYADDTLFLSDADFQVYKSGSLDLKGEMSLKGGGYNFDGDLRDVDCSEVLEGDWRKRLEGSFKTSFSVSNPTGTPKVSGQLSLVDATLTALPLLDTLSAYADTSRFRRISLQEAKCHYDWQDGALQLKGIVLSSKDLVQVEGFINVAKNREIDGVFRLGLTPGILSSIPGAETDVFIKGDRQMLWTTLRITGTLDHPKEDLSDRLIQAAGYRMFEYLPETGEKVLKFTHGVLGKELPDALRQGVEVVGPEAILQGKRAVEQGKEVLGQGKGLLKDARGVAKDVTGDIFDVLRGRDEPEPAPPAPAPPAKKGE
jgi:hypothetical protein